VPYKTTIFGGGVDVGDTGIKIVGILWLLTALAFTGAGGLAVNRDFSHG
jgi:hypothetical protein